MKRKALSIFARSLTFIFLFTLFSINVQAAETVTSDRTGTHGGYYFSFWNQGGGSVVMTLGDGGNYSVQWSNCSNFTCGKGWATGSPNRIINFTGSFNGGNNGYLALYGWTKNALIEYYIIENYGQWVPPGGNSIGTMTSDGGTYNIYKMVRTNQPSIIGTATFDQFFSVRTSKRSTGSITFSNHVNAWRNKGLYLGSTWDYQIMESEGYQSSGSANITVSEGSAPAPQPTSVSTAAPQPTSVSTASKNECEGMLKSGQYTGNISSPFAGVALYGNNDSVKYTQYFSEGTNSFSLRGCSNNSNMAKVDLKIGGVTKGTFYYGGSSPAVYTIDNVSHGTGNQEIELVVTSDDGNWDAYLDYLQIQNVGTTVTPAPITTPAPTAIATQAPTSAPGSTAAKTECESMTKAGQYTGNISSPFTGVALYGNNDSVKFTQNFSTSTNSFSLRGCSNNSNMARVDLKIGGQYKGTFYYGGSSPAVYTINNVSHGTGNQEIELIVTADNGQWDAYLDYLEIK